MKRSPLRRRKPLRSNAEKQREWERRTQEKLRERPEHGVVLNQRRGRERAESSELAEARAFVKARAGGMCEAGWEGVCPPGPHRGHHAHHAVLRSQGGGDTAANLLWICWKVHDHAHNVDRAGAEERGIIRRG